MVVDSPATDAVFHALADATRRDIVRRVLLEDQSVSALAAHYAMSFAAVQKHVAVLERAEVVTKHRQGREVRVRANVIALQRASLLLTQLAKLWTVRLNQIDHLLELPPGADR